MSMSRYKFSGREKLGYLLLATKHTSKRQGMKRKTQLFLVLNAFPCWKRFYCKCKTFSHRSLGRFFLCLKKYRHLLLHRANAWVMERWNEWAVWSSHKCPHRNRALPAVNSYKIQRWLCVSECARLQGSRLNFLMVSSCSWLMTNKIRFSGTIEDSCQ